MKQYTYFSAIVTSVYLNTATIQLRHSTNFHFSDNKGKNGHRLCNNKDNCNTYYSQSRLESYCKIWNMMTSALYKIIVSNHNYTGYVTADT